ncbi:hypothetical protein [Planococcus sp. A6]|uniref:hypothetical protein n=1 Tax=Planococcus sp. A6 TaxID=2992760 RepID=UPI0038B42E48
MLRQLLRGQAKFYRYPEARQARSPSECGRRFHRSVSDLSGNPLLRQALASLHPLQLHHRSELFVSGHHTISPCFSRNSSLGRHRRLVIG